MKILEEYGLQISITSTLNPLETSYVVISRETERFVDDIHDHKQELRSSDELLTAFQKSERKEPCMEEGGSNRTKETYAPKGNKETCANSLSNPTSDSLFKKTVIPAGERKWITIEASPSLFNTGIQDGHKDDTSSRSRRTRTRWMISLGYREIGVAEGVCTEKSRRIF